MQNVKAFRQMLDESIAVMEKWQDAEGHADLICRFKTLGQKAASQAFNIRLIDNIILVTFFAVVLTYFDFQTGAR